MSELEEVWLTLYIALALTCGVLVIWTVRLIQRSDFLDICEPASLNMVRRVALAAMGISVLFALRWHVENARPPWPSEMMMLVGLDLYLAIAICSTYVRARRCPVDGRRPRWQTANRLPSSPR